MSVHFYIRRNFAYPFIEMLRFQLENDVHKMHKPGIVQKLIKETKKIISIKQIFSNLISFEGKNLVQTQK